jgi:nitroreductase
MGEKDRGAHTQFSVRDVRVVAMTPLGYPNQPPSQKFRKSLDQIVCYEKYE